MKITVEKSLKLPVRSFPNKNDPTARWYIAEQQALMFKDDSKYPDKFNINLAFTSDENEANNAKPFPEGNYQLLDTAFSVDRNGAGTCDFSKLEKLS